LGKIKIIELMKNDSPLPAGVYGPANQEEKYRIVANITYSREVVEMAALSVQESPKWQTNQKIQQLKISAHWS
jgi:hypothetical protein